jgi:hypothetical protein
MLFRTAALFLVALSLGARVTRITVERRESPAYGAQSFGKAGQYETLAGHFYGELDPKDSRNAIINDIQLAPRNARGMVEYSATFTLAKPIDMSKASGVLYYLVPNRGNGAPAASETGDVSLVSGWQGDLLSRPNAQTIIVPVAKNRDLAGAAQPVKARRVELPWLRGHWLDRLPAIDPPGASIDVVVGSQREELAQIVREHHLFK